MAFTPFTETDRPTMANFNSKFLEILSEDIKMETGSYTGTGTSGESNPTQITFQNRPDFLLIYPVTDNGETTHYIGAGAHTMPSILIPYYSLFYYKNTLGREHVGFQTYTYTGNTATVYCNFSDDGKTFQFYAPVSGPESADSQFNLSGIIYEYIAFRFNKE